MTKKPALPRLLLLAALTSLALGSAQAAAPMAKTNAPGFFRTMLGDFEVTVLNDGTVDLPVNKILMPSGKILLPSGKGPQPNPDLIDKVLAKSFLKSPLETSVNAYLINTGTKLVLIDTGAGGLFGPTLGRLAANLKASGYQPEQVDEIYITHMHGDHMGGLAPGGAAQFPNAIVRADKHDADFWLSQEQMDKAPEAMKGYFKGAMAMFKPYIDSQRFKPFDTDAELVPGIKASATYGHTPGHSNYVIESKGQKLVLVGDLIHVGAVQFDAPDTTIQFDSDTKAALAQRLKTFDAVAKDGALMGTAHIQFPGMGHLKKNGKSYQWIPVNYTQIR